MTRRALAVAILLATTLESGFASAYEYDEPTPFPSLVWTLTQLLPSPELFTGTGGTRYGMRWQVTPVLYSFGANRRISPWRWFVVDPMARQSGSIELFFSPEYVAESPRLADDAILRTGVRSYFPLVEKGDYLSVSLGASHYLFEGHSGAAIEGGVYVLFGILGLQVTYSPSALPAQWITTIRIRNF